MCGILGTPRITPDIRRMLPFVALFMEERGTDEWGATNGQEIIKHTGPLHKTWASEAGRIAEWDQGIFHTRGASVGSKDLVDNAHPFEFTGPAAHVIGIHNGGISNYAELNRVHGRNLDVDSMHLWAHRAAGLPWTDLRGVGNVAWYEDHPGREQSLYIARINSTALHVVQVADGGIMFASTFTSMAISAVMTGSRIVDTYKIDEYQKYLLTTTEEAPAGVILKTDEFLRFAHIPPTVAVSPTGYESHSRYGYQRELPPPKGGGPYCRKCTALLPAHGAKGLLCGFCLRGFISDWRQHTAVQSKTSNSQNKELVVYAGAE